MVTKILCYGVACLDFPPWPSILYVIIILLGVLFKMLPGILWTVIAMINNKILLQLAFCSFDICPSWSMSLLLESCKYSFFLCVSCDVSLLCDKLWMEISVWWMLSFDSFSLHALPFWKSPVRASAKLDDSTPLEKENYGKLKIDANRRMMLK